MSLELGTVVSAKEEYCEERVKKCLCNSDFGDRLEKLDYGLKTYVDIDYEFNGIQFSGGERQKIAIARAIYKEPTFLILDEPNAALDPISEKEIYENFLI